MAAFYRSLAAWFSGLILLTGCARAGGEPAQYTANQGLTLRAGHTVSQTVNPAGTTIKAIDVLVLAVTEPGAGDLELKLQANGQTLDTTRHRLDTIQDDSWISFPLNQATSLPDVVDIALSVDGDGAVLLGVNATPEDAHPAREPNHDPYLQGEARADGTPINGDIAFRVVGPGSIAAFGRQLLAIARSGAARLRDSGPFTLVWAVAMVGAIALGVWGLAGKRL